MVKGAAQPSLGESAHAIAVGIICAVRMKPWVTSHRRLNPVQVDEPFRNQDFRQRLQPHPHSARVGQRAGLFYRR
jgi:hypothetical protein